MHLYIRTWRHVRYSNLHHVVVNNKVPQKSKNVPFKVKIYQFICPLLSFNLKVSFFPIFPGVPQVGKELV